MLFLVDSDNATKYGEDIFQCERDFQHTIKAFSKQKKSRSKDLLDIKTDFYVILNKHFPDIFPSTPPVDIEDNTMNVDDNGNKKRGRIPNSAYSSSSSSSLPRGAEEEKIKTVKETFKYKSTTSSSESATDFNATDTQPVLAITTNERAALKTILSEIMHDELAVPFLYPVDLS